MQGTWVSTIPRLGAQGTGQQEPCPLPRAELERAEGPIWQQRNRAAQRERGSSTQGPSGPPRRGRSKAQTQGPRVSLPSVQPAAHFVAWPGWQGRRPLPHGTEVAEAAGFS